MKIRRSYKKKKCSFYIMADSLIVAHSRLRSKGEGAAAGRGSNLGQYVISSNTRIQLRHNGITVHGIAFPTNSLHKDVVGLSLALSDTDFGLNITCTCTPANNNNNNNTALAIAASGVKRHKHR